MKRKTISFLFMLVLMLVASTAAFAGVEIKLKDGSRWRGEVNDVIKVTFMQSGVEVPMEGRLTKVEDLYIQVDGTIGTLSRPRTIYRADIVSMSTVSKSAGAAGAPDAAGGAAATPDGSGAVPKTGPGGSPLGVFVLPLKGTVGETFRSNEVLAMGEHADKFGPGQIIVLFIESPGGLVIETEKIHLAVAEVRKRHRVVAWIKEAISAAAATASNCDEIYFQSMGTLGAMTMFAGAVAAQGEELQEWLDTAGRWMESGGRSKWIAHAMIDDGAMLSYDKDPVTGEVTWRNDMGGQVIMSTEKTNLVFNAVSALESGFSDGTADTTAELAKLLDLPEWREIDDYGRKLAADWQATVKLAQQEIPLLAARLNYKGAGSGDQRIMTGNQIKILQQLIRWWDRCPNVCFLSGIPSKEELQEIIEGMRRSLR